MTFMIKWHNLLIGFSAATSGWAGWALAQPEFGSSVNPITTRGADYAHHITASPPGFEIPTASLDINCRTIPTAFVNFIATPLISNFLRIAFVCYQ